MANRPGGVRSQGEAPGLNSNTRPPSSSLPLGGPESFLQFVASPRAATSNRLPASGPTAAALAARRQRPPPSGPTRRLLSWRPHDFHIPSVSEDTLIVKD